jgi:hypothetical protein
MPSSLALTSPPFAGKHLIFPENLVNAPCARPYPVVGRKTPTARELAMIQNQNPKRNFSSFVGTTMLIAGSAVLVTYSAALAWQFHSALTSTDSIGFLGGLTLASLHAMRILVLDQAVLLSVAHRILVLCSALIVMLIGIALLPKRAPRITANGWRGHASALPKGDH